MDLKSRQKMGKKSTLEMFSEFQTSIANDQKIREDIKTIVQGLEQMAREILAITQSIHQKADRENVQHVCLAVRGKLSSVAEQVKLLQSKIPSGQYFRFHDHWKLTFQRFVFLMALITYLEKDELLSREEAANMLQLKVDWKEGFHLELDDYLIGVLQLASELSRMCVNTVIAGDYEKPIKIAAFISELDAAFRLLNMKNDALRRRFDGLKYDLKKVEEVVYDLSIRGLKH